MLDLEPASQFARQKPSRTGTQSQLSGTTAKTINAWRLVAWTSIAWIAVLGVTVVGFLSTLDRQDRKLELLLQRTEVIKPNRE
jgi:hypothetical protein